MTGDELPIAKIRFRKPKEPKATKPRSKLKTSGRIAPNRKRQKRLFEENFGGKDYHALIVSLPCDVCGVEGFTVAAHLTSRGAGGKADVISPLCANHPCLDEGSHNFGEIIYGCHEAYDFHDVKVRAEEFRLRELAKARWTVFQYLTQTQTRKISA